jgi:hypothetical protein
MRMVLNDKQGSDVPLRNVTGDPFSKSETLFLMREYEDSEDGARGNCSITQHINNIFTSTYVHGNALDLSASTSTRKRNRVNKKHAKLKPRADSVEIESSAKKNMTTKNDTTSLVEAPSTPQTNDSTSIHNVVTDSVFPMRNPFERKTTKLFLKHARPRTIRGRALCHHGILRTVCSICDPVGYKIARIRSSVAGGLRRVGTVKSRKTLEYLGVDSFDCFINNMQGKMDRYNLLNPEGVQMTWDNIQIDHIKPAKAFGDEINHFTNLQPLLPVMNARKKAHWSKQDEVFWRENIQNHTDYIDIYTETHIQNTTLHNGIASSTITHDKVAANNVNCAKKQMTINFKT